MAKKQTAKQKKVAKVMGEFRRGSLKSASGRKVTSVKQAQAIAISEGNRVSKRRNKR